MIEFLREDIIAAISANSPAHRGLRSDYDMNPNLGSSPGEAGKTLRRAAVLIPIVEHGDGLTLLLTKRTAHLNTHAGQVAFPGGSVDDTDADDIAAALREANEEVGLGENFIEVIGTLDTYETGTNFSITPVVAMVRPGFELTLDPHEVESAFEVPLSFMMDHKNHERQNGIYKNIRRYYYSIEYENQVIWGVTASIFMNLFDVLAHHAQTQGQGDGS